MKIYVSHSTTFDFKAELYEPIKAHMGKVHEYHYPHDHDSDGTYAKDRITASDMILAEVSYPSTGQGIELGWAEDYGVPIVAIYKTGSVPSGAISMIGADLRAYGATDELLVQVQRGIDSLKSE